jgi:hypothetical protein
MTETLFYLPVGTALKEAGQASAAEGRGAVLALAQQTAREIAAQRGQVTSDMVRQAFDEAGRDFHELGPAAGLIFRRGFVRVGMVKSEYPGNHAALIGVWRLRK